MVCCYAFAIVIRFWAGLGFVMWTDRFDFGGETCNYHLSSKTLKIIDGINVLGGLEVDFNSREIINLLLLYYYYAIPGFFLFVLERRG